MKHTKKWPTKTGKKIRICDMTDTHLINTINMIERRAKQETDNALSAAYRAEMFLTGEMALMSIENEIRHLEEEGLPPDELCPLYKDLVEEALDRDLI